MKKILILTYSLFSFLICNQLNAETIPFALPPINAFSAGMGFASVAYPDDPSTIYWNPSGLGSMNQLSVDMSVAMSHAGAPGSWSFLMANSAGANESRIGFGMIRRYARLADDRNVRSFEVLLPLSHRIKSGMFPIGITLKFITERLPDSKWHAGMALDFGMLWNSPSGFRVGFASQNAVGSNLDAFERRNWLGASWKSWDNSTIISFQLGADDRFEWSNLDEHYGVGLNYLLGTSSAKSNQYGVRAGYLREGETGWLSGGIEMNQADSDYRISYTMAVNPDGWSDRTHFLTYGYCVDVKPQPTIMPGGRVRPALP